MAKPGVNVRATFGMGPVGTGAHLVGYRGPSSEPQDVEVWLLLVFFPVIPVARWRLAAVGGEGLQGAALDLTVQSKSRIAVRAALWRLVNALVGSAVTVLPLGFAVWTVGLSWATSLMTDVFGAIVGAGLLGKVGMAIEVGVALLGGALPILVLMHLDGVRPRISLRTALGIGELGGSARTHSVLGTVGVPANSAGASPS